MSRRPWLAALLLACAVLPAGAEQPVEAVKAAASPFDAFRAFRLDAGRTIAAPVSAKFGRFEIELASGRVFPVKDGSGTVTGVQIEGQGTWRYTVDDRDELRTFADRAHYASNQFDVGDHQVRDRFTRATVFFARPAFEPLWKEGGAEAPSSGADAALRESLKGIDDAEVGIDHMLAEVRLDESAAQYVYGEFDGGPSGRVAYEYDGVRNFRERLAGRFEYGFVGWSGPPLLMQLYAITDLQMRYFTERRFSRMICEQKIGGVDYLRTVEYRLEHVDIDVNTPDNRKGSINSVVRVRVERPNQRVLSFMLANNRDPRRAVWTSATNPLRVRRVVDEKGAELPFSHRYNELLVDLGAPQPAGTERTLHVETEGEFFTAHGGWTGDNYIDLFRALWFPRSANDAANRFTFSLSVRTKKPYRPVAAGEDVSLTEDGDFYVLKAKSDVPVKVLALFAGKYKTEEIKGERWTVRVNEYAIGKDEDRARIAKITAGFLEIYEKLLGPYPFKKLELVESPTFSFYGISPASIVVLTSRTFKTNDSRFDSLLGNRGVNAMLAHEIAHQWFGHKAWPVLREDTWLDESCAEYMAGVAMGIATQGQDVNRARLKDFRGMLDDWRSWNRSVLPNHTIAGADAIASDSAYQYRIFLLYNRGPLVLHMLRTLVGDERFFAILRQYLADANGGPATIDTMAKAATKVLGMDMAWFFDQWFRDPGVPAIKVQQSVDGTTLKVKLTQAPDRPFKKIHVPFVLEFPDGHREVKLAFQEQPTQEFSFPLSAKPGKVVVDPAHNNLADYE